MKLKDLLYVTTFGTKVVLFAFEDGAMKPRIEFVVGEQPKEYDDFNIRSVDLIGDELHLRVSNKETAQEVPVQEALSKEEAICIYRHLKVFVEKEWDRKENVPDACTNCDQYCNKEDRQGLNPWIAFYKLSKLACEPYFGREGADK